MKINLTAKRFDLTEAIKNYAQLKMDMLDKYLGSLSVQNCDVELERVGGDQNKGDIFRVEVNLAVPGQLLRVEKTAADLYKAIDKVKDHLEEIIVSYREKERDKARS